MNELTIHQTDNPALVYLASLPAETGRRTQGQALRVISSYLGFTDPLAVDWSQLRYQHAAAIRTKLIENYSPASVRKMLCALRGVLHQAWKLGQMSAEDYYRAIDLEPVTGETLPAGRYITQDEILAMLKVCDPSPAGTRDAAIILILYMVGMRRSEVANLKLSDYEPARGKLSITGKRSKQRFDFLPPDAKQALDDWLKLRGSQSGPIFLPVDQKDNIVYTDTITDQAIYFWWNNRREQAGIPPCSPHSARRSNITNMLSLGIDALTIAKSKGHKKVDTVRIYDRRTEEAQYQAAQLLKIEPNKLTADS